MKFIHTADIHLGKPFAFLGEKGKLLRESQLKVLKKITELAQSEAVDFLIIAGDLFESNEISSRLVKKTLDILKSTDPIPVYVLPGTHDLLDDQSVYRRKEFQQSNIKVFGIDDKVFRLKNITIHGRPNDTKQGGVHPLKELKADDSVQYNVGVIHASMDIKGKSNPEDYLITKTEIEASNMDYIALGHWHRMSDFSSKGVTAWYCGSPEITKFDEADKAGYVLIINLDKKTTVDARKVRNYEWIEKTMDVAINTPGDLLDSEIKRLCGENILLKLKLKGILPQGHQIDVNQLEEEFEDDFFFFTADVSKVGYPVNKVKNLFAEGTIGDLYVKRLEALIKQAENKEKKEILEKALSLGASFISKQLEVE